MNKAMKVVVAYGGISSEREVSLRSGAAIAQALMEVGFTNVSLFDLTENNAAELIMTKPDAVYIALHGEGGEDGQIQGMLQLAGIPYTGPGIAASAICMNKIYAKQILDAAGVPSAKYIALRKEECTDCKALYKRLAAELGMPLVVKSPSQGSSIGVVIVHSEAEFEPAVEEVFEYGDELLAEEFLDGTEITVPIIGNDELTVLPEIEITSENEFYDYQAKYTQGMCHHIIPARISDEDRDKAAEIAKRAYKATGCRGIARVDMMVDRKKGPMVIELNTSPGMTAMSLVPDSGRAAGIPFGELLARILGFALEGK